MVMYGKPMSPEPAEPKFNACGGGVTLPCALLLPPTSGLSLRSENKRNYCFIYTRAARYSSIRFTRRNNRSKTIYIRTASYFLDAKITFFFFFKKSLRFLKNTYFIIFFFLFRQKSRNSWIIKDIKKKKNAELGYFKNLTSRVTTTFTFFPYTV